MVIKSDAPKYSILHDLTPTIFTTERFTVSPSESCADTTDTSRSDDELNPIDDLASARPSLHTTNIAQPRSPILLLHRN